MYYLLVIQLYGNIENILLFKQRDNAVKNAIEYMKSTDDYTDEIGKSIQEEGYWMDAEEYNIQIIELELEDNKK